MNTATPSAAGRNVISPFASGLRAAEGPVMLADGSVLVCEILGGSLAWVGPDGAIGRRIELGGGANGAAIGPDGRCYVCNNGGLSEHDIKFLSQGLPSDADPSQGCIQVVDLASGAVETLYDACDGVRLNAPNDLVFDAHGGFYFTDHGNLRVPTPERGAVYYAWPDGSEIRLVVPDLERPNGVGLSPDGAMLYVAETHSGRLWRVPVTGPGAVDQAARAVLFHDPGLSLDSLAVQEDGAVCVACPSNDLILRVAVDGRDERFATPPGWPTNICFGGPGRRTAYVTSIMSGELWRADWDAPGLRLAFGDPA